MWPAAARRRAAWRDMSCHEGVRSRRRSCETPVHQGLIESEKLFGALPCLPHSTHPQFTHVWRMRPVFPMRGHPQAAGEHLEKTCCPAKALSPRSAAGRWPKAPSSTLLLRHVCVRRGSPLKDPAGRSRSKNRPPGSFRRFDRHWSRLGLYVRNCHNLRHASVGPFTKGKPTAMHPRRCRGRAGAGGLCETQRGGREGGRIAGSTCA
jgi:hypothetical protein